MKLTDDQKFQVLMAQMQERYTAWHNMRARSTKFTLWILGMAIALCWTLLSNPCSSIGQQIAATALILSLAGVSWYFLWAINRGCNKNREALMNVESALGCHNPNQFLEEKPLLSDEYKEAKPGISNHFRTLYALLLITLIYLITAIWVPLVDAPDDKKDNSTISCKIGKNVNASEVKK